MGKALGISAFVLALIAVFTPFFGLYVTFIALVLATIGALAGDKVFSLVTVVIGFVNTFLLSPFSVMMLFGAQDQAGNTPLLTVTIVLLVAPIIAIFLNATGRVAIGRHREGLPSA